MSQTHPAGRPPGPGPMPGPVPGPAAPSVRRARRDLDRGMVGGVAAGLSTHLGVPLPALRVAFAVATLLSGLGVVLYGAYWMFLPAGTSAPTAAPGLASASRGGRRPARGRHVANVGQAAVVGSIAVGGVLVAEAVVGRSTLVWATALVLGGVALLWRQADEAQRERWVERSESIDPVGMVLGSGGWAAYARIAAGAALLGSGLLVLVLREGGVGAAREVVVAVLLGIVGLGVVVGPWVSRLVADLGEERAERVRSQERADVAAHLHDSVLQTLALIQKNAKDPAAVARLARSQERDLRAWLFAEERPTADTLAGAVRALAAAVEDDHGVEVEVVTVGDAPYVERLDALVGATREAVVNAAKHAGTGRVDVYVEVVGGAVEVFVRDRGVGFDPEDLPADRHGVRGSIVERMARHGGRATLRSSPATGTEVRLHLPAERENDEQQH
ncbi:PspC domain-containing protein [Nocardioides zeae]|uniref:PspC domain-containing protein n=1 Tax=Nocardioides imazamoxiresistens TaxID=3231893 RepID=A0ABU3PU90_9ACTN|nr:ATP-binding protein [Nocardioides zeae]MDT9592790.1 PspC domain-containing protein [Nocardioides zeae]